MHVLRAAAFPSAARRTGRRYGLVGAPQTAESPAPLPRAFNIFYIGPASNADIRLGPAETSDGIGAVPVIS